MYSPIISTNPKIMSDEIQKLKDQDVSTGKSIDTLRAFSAKNMNTYPYYETTKTTDQGVTFTDRGDGSVYVSADSITTGTSSFVCHSRVLARKPLLILPNGRYRVSGWTALTPSGQLTVAITKGSAGVKLAEDTGKGAEFTINGDDNYTDKAVVQIAIDIKKSVTVNAIITPMIECLELADPDAWQSYSLSNSALTSKVNALECKETTAGTYKLEATVDASGDVSYEWVEVV